MQKIIVSKDIILLQPSNIKHLAKTLAFTSIKEHISDCDRFLVDLEGGTTEHYSFDDDSICV